MALICHCTGVSDRQIAEHVAAGVDELDSLQDVCGAGASCGGCLDAVEASLASACRRLSSAAA